ncbi:hypothetical protein M0813_12093 [Anaeramoeba flamelloides]|uniref:Uncharacterized protein n=1 Tax=Anaeramoeba flamelloides TaxID=1746091 RepID=A0ABQ8ZD10_9EUKA|nr:hypothetical protein M0813_12093 [Anaeramoeba flamelloides]
MAYWFAFGDNHKGLLGIKRDREVLELKELQVVPQGTVKQIVSTRSATVFLTSAGELYSIYAAGSPDETVLRKFDTEKIASVISGNAHFIALSQNNSIYTWGVGAVGQLGHGTKQSLKEPKKLLFFENKNPFKIAASFSTSFVLCENGNLFAFGNGFFGELGNGKNYSLLKPALVQQKISNLYFGLSYHVFAEYQNGEKKGWGRNDSGQIGNNSKKNQFGPAKIKFFRQRKIQYIYPGMDFSIAISLEGKIFSTGNSRNSCQPKDIKAWKEIDFFSDMIINFVSVGDEYTFVITDDNILYGFGAKMETYGSRSDLVQKPPITIPKGFTIFAIKAGHTYSCFLKVSPPSNFVSSRPKQEIVRSSDIKENNNVKKQSNTIKKETTIEQKKPNEIKQFTTIKPKTVPLQTRIETNYFVKKSNQPPKKKAKPLMKPKLNNTQTQTQQQKQLNKSQKNQNNTQNKSNSYNNEINELFLKVKDYEDNNSNNMNQQSSLKENETQSNETQDETMKQINELMNNSNKNKQTQQQQQQQQEEDSQFKNMSLDSESLNKYLTKQEFDQLYDLIEEREVGMLNGIEELQNDKTQTENDLDILINFEKKKELDIQEIEKQIKNLSDIYGTSNEDENTIPQEKVSEIQFQLEHLQKILLEKDNEIKQLNSMNQIFQDCIKILQQKSNNLESELNKVTQLLIKLTKK